jgi:hypothetical protein
VNRVAIIVVCFALVLFVAWATFVSLLMRSPDKFLAITVAGTDDFLQVTATSDSAQIDFPLITERQRSFEPKILQAARELGLDFHEARGSDGSRFLDCDFTGTSGEIADACRKLLIHVYGISDSTPLLFETDASI